MEYRLLGPLEVAEQGRSLPLGGPRQKTVLADLLIHRDRVVATDRLILDLWGDEPPPGARGTLQSYVSNLRRVLGENRIEGRSSGYVLVLDGDELDAARFEALIRQAHDTLSSDPQTASALLHEALGLWRGSPLADLSGDSFLRPEASRLEQLHQMAIEELAAAELDLGNHVALVPQLEVLVHEKALRERLWAYLMLALYRSDRQAEALAVYERLRATLVDELGIDPSPEVQRLHTQILRQDPSLAAPASARSRAVPTTEPMTRNPYKGLHPFEETDAADFFGRRASVGDLVARISGSNCRLITIVGPSGSGKSSLVRAGLIPALRAGAVGGSEKWTIVQFPRAHPAGDLAVALDRLRRQEGEILVVVDQFEEIFTRSDESSRRGLLNVLEAGLTDPHSGLRAMIVLRADFYDRPLEARGLAALMRANTETVIPLSPEEIVQAIVEPAERAGVRLEDGLLGEIIADVTDEPGYLPLLQFALTELFEKRSGAQLTLAAYRAFGGVSGALVKRAEDLYLGLHPTRREAARQMFLRLVTLGEGVEDTRRRVLRSELTELDLDRRAMDEVLVLFGSHRLLSFDRDAVTRSPTVEIAHEALLRAWARLGGWIHNAREDVRTNRLLSAAAQQWAESDREPSLLLRGAHLARFEIWARSTDIAPRALEREYLERSVAAREAEVREEERRVAHELALKKRSVSRLRALVVVLIVGVLVAASLTTFAIGQRRRAEREARLSEARELAAASEANLETDPDLAILLALAAVEATRERDGVVLRAAEEALHKAIGSTRVAARLPPAGDITLAADAGMIAVSGEKTTLIDAETLEEVRSLPGSASTRVALSPDGTLVAAGADGRVDLWRVDDGRLFGSVEGLRGFLDDMAISSDGRMLAVMTSEGIHLWDLASRSERRVLPNPGGGIGLDFSHDGRSLAVAGGPTSIVYGVGSGREKTTLEVAGRGIAFAPDGKRVAVTVEGGAVIFDAASGERVLSVSGHAGLVNRVVYSADGRWFATAGHDGTARIWDASSGSEVMVLPGQVASVDAVYFSRDGRHLIGTGTTATLVWDITPAGLREHLTVQTSKGQPFNVGYDAEGARFVTASEEGTAVWDATSGESLRSFGPPSFDAVFSPDGKHVAVGGIDGSVTIWDASSGDPQVDLAGHEAPVWGTSFSPDGKRLVTASEDLVSKVWDVATGATLATFDDHEDHVYDAVFSPDGHFVATVGNDFAARLWDPESGEQLAEMRHRANVVELAFDPGSEMLATAGFDGAKVWSIPSGAELFKLQGHGGIVLDVDFSPDGKRIATASLDGTARLWDARTGREVLKIEGDGTGFGRLAFSPDGKRLAVASEVGLVHVFALDLNELVRMGRSRATRSFTQAECRQYLHLGTCS